MSIVVTGLGLVTPFGSNLNEVWNNLIEGKSAIKLIKDFDISDLSCKIAAYIEDDKFDFEKWRKTVPVFKTSKFNLYGIEATFKALLDADLIKNDNEKIDPKLKISVVIGSGIGGIDSLDFYSKYLFEKGAKGFSPFCIPSLLTNLLPGYVAIKYGIKGLSQSQVTACATGAVAIEDAARLIREKRCDIAITGASEGAICRLAFAGFSAMKALTSNYNDNPSLASRPFDEDRSGFVMGEGAGVLILEDLEHAKKRGARIYCEYVSAGITSDAYNIVAPLEGGEGAAAAMQEALNLGNITADKIDYINAHATSTLQGDTAEIRAIKTVFNSCIENICVSSIKGSIGHTLGASGAIEAIISILALCKNEMPPTINLNKPDKECYYKKNNDNFDKLINLIPNNGVKKKLNYVLSNSFGFGGHNISLLFKRYQIF